MVLITISQTVVFMYELPYTQELLECSGTLHEKVNIQVRADSTAALSVIQKCVWQVCR